MAALESNGHPSKFIQNIQTKKIDPQGPTFIQESLWSFVLILNLFIV